MQRPQIPCGLPQGASLWDNILWGKNVLLARSRIKDTDGIFCANIGLTMSSAFNVFARTAVRQQKIPFELTLESDPFYSESNIKVLGESIKQLEEGKGIEHELIEV